MREANREVDEVADMRAPTTPAESRLFLAQQMSEEELQNWVINTAHMLGWKVAHFRPGLTQSGNWRTACQADAKGWPDLVLVRGNQVIYAELKSEKGKLSDDQLMWLTLLSEAGQQTYVWRPRDMPEIERILRQRGR